jgi:tetratricopeptide (TPR) repeat protein
MIGQTRLLLALCLFATAAYAGPQEDAKAHFKQGKAYQEAGAYLRAAAEFEAAYALDARAEMLFNIAQAYRLGGDKPHAVEYFTRYLAERPDGAAADEARSLVAELQRQIDDDKARETPPQNQTPPPPPPPHAEAHQEIVFVRASPPVRYAGVATAGAGVIALGLGVKLGLDARSDSDYISHYVGTWGPTERQRYLDGQAANRDMEIAYVVGGGLVAAGAVMFWWGSRVQAMPVVGAQAAGVAITGAW